MTEYALIRHLFGDAVPELFTSDAQFFEVGGETWGITCDTFSPEEDLFSADDPRRFGVNAVRGTLSDLAASGCVPALFLQAVTFPRGASDPWLAAFAEGVKAALADAGCRLLGGDMGEGAGLVYTGIALGPRRRPLSRILPDTPQRLWTTGPFGAFNVAALAGAPAPEIPRREPPPAATACIDTSGGFADALWQLHQLNPRHDFRLGTIPVAPPGNPALLFGGAGEYELLFTTPLDAPVPDGAHAIGTVMPGSGTVDWAGRLFDAPPPDPRAFASRPAYIEAVIRASAPFGGHP
ncbi:MAG: hypothetical protein J6334_11020 [Kiritimatiellae bacterium]|nr:hypothetical protein [Kiritimatiellia bacterium]